MNSYDGVQVQCPYCGEFVDISIDVTEIDEDFMEDCTVCCRPMVLHLSLDEDESPRISARSETD